MTPGAYRRRLDLISRGVLRVAHAAALLLLGPRNVGAPQGEVVVVPMEYRTAFVDVVLPQVTAAREEAYGVAVEFLDAQRAVQGAKTPPPVPEIREYRREFLQAGVDEALDNNKVNPIDAVVGTVVKHVEAAARAVPTDSAKAQNESRPPGVEAQGWARMLTGADNCAFCVTMASRGAVYESRKTALFGPDMQKYHPDCDCVAVPVFNRNTWPGWAEARKLYAFYEEAIATNPDTHSINAVRRHLRTSALPEIADLRSLA
ncbi:putative capsid maturation protease [uncultured Caudovirales phage]|uniref:Putative capsid maturation protease n=1 Tax=uncultured Caudovirales phage TaxID=2100421 RepID=A0A2H4J285_9CAUD|nr:putative capsid maturation protease [uncultured Caudovirales phage]